LLMSATPVINQLGDLAAQLILAVRDDALRAFGCSSLRGALERNHVPAALGELMVSGCGGGGGRPDRVARRECIGMAASGMCRLRGIDRLVLSRRPGVAQLIRWVLYRAIASSPAALLASLHRYRTLLLQASDAARAGIAPDRSSLRRWAGQLPDQLVLWELVESPDSQADLVTEDLEVLTQLISGLQSDSFLPDSRAVRLREILADNDPTLVFTTHRETVSYLRQHLPRHVAWCTGSAAGWQGQRVARETVLGAFTPGGSPISIGRQPSILVTTDVTAEGLDLQTARRVVHYDLPWTATRVDQREGRVHRLGGLHRTVEIIQFDPPPALERRLSQLSILERKGDLPRRAGIGEEARATWTWRDRVARQFGHLPACGGVARVRHREEGIVAAVGLYPAGSSGVTVLGCWRPRHGWTDNPGVIDSFVQAASTMEMSSAGCLPEITRTMGLVLPWIRRMLRRYENGRRAGNPAPWQRRLLGRLRRQASIALRRRDARMLEVVDRAMGFVRQGHTAGEVHWLRGVEPGDDCNLLQALADVPRGEPRLPGGPPVIISILVFG
ncbi:MAG: C-terminal helicase domain-containing protein, partial [Gemmatimonadales bacterium]